MWVGESIHSYSLFPSRFEGCSSQAQVSSYDIAVLDDIFKENTPSPSLSLLFLKNIAGKRENRHFSAAFVTCD